MKRLSLVLLGWIAPVLSGPAFGAVIGTATNPANAHVYHLLAPTTWTLAEVEATALGGHLVTVSNQDENDWIRSQWPARDVIWIGMNDETSEGTFEWSSGETIFYTNWRSGEPNGGPGADYVRLMNPEGWWEDTTAGGDNKTYGVVEVQAPRIVDSANYPHDSHTYYLLSATTWSNAENKAQQLGGHLVTVNSADEGNWIRTRWPAYERIWLGMTDAAAEGTFEWVSGQPITYTDWASGEPDGGAAHDYVCTQGPMGHWVDQGLYGDAPTFAVAEVVSVLATIDHATEIAWFTEPGASYQVQYSDDPSTHSWSNVNSVVLGTGGTAHVFDSTWDIPHRVYRVVTLE